MDKRDLYDWCRIPVDELAHHPARRLALRVTADSAAMGEVMARDFAEELKLAHDEDRSLRAIVPCGPSSWYAPFARIVNDEGISLRRLQVFHMDECLDWQGRTLPRAHPYSFRGFMEKHFYGPIRSELAVEVHNRRWLEPTTMREVEEDLDSTPADLVLGGWGQDGHVAYNQARRTPFSPLSLDEERRSGVRIQDNNVDTVIALGQRQLGSAFQLVPPMSVTLGMRQILASSKIRLFSDTGAWKQTALRVALFSAPHPEYPITLLQGHQDVLVTATRETASHPISEHPEWDFGLEG